MTEIRPINITGCWAGEIEQKRMIKRMDTAEIFCELDRIDDEIKFAYKEYADMTRSLCRYLDRLFDYECSLKNELVKRITRTY